MSDDDSTDSADQAAASDKDEELMTAQVILAPEGSEQVTSDIGHQLASAFSRDGFEVGPVVGISFAVSGPRHLFRAVLGTADPGSSLEFDRAALLRHLDPKVAQHIAAVTLTAPPDFGPGNP